MPKVVMPAPPHARTAREALAGHKHMSVVSRIPQMPQYPPHPPEGYFSDSRPPPSASQYETPQYPSGKKAEYLLFILYDVYVFVSFYSVIYVIL